MTFAELLCFLSVCTVFAFYNHIIGNEIRLRRTTDKISNKEFTDFFGSEFIYKCRRFSVSVFVLFFVIAVASCSYQSNNEVDRLNGLSYKYHYRNLDSTYYYAEKALTTAGGYDAGKAEAYNNLAFVSMAKMDYKQAAMLLDSARNTTDNQIELLITDIQNMRLCQRKSDNKEFYNYQESAKRRFRRINEERNVLSEHVKLRMVYARTEYDIITSAYYYYVGLERQATEALKDINPYGEIQQDTAQYLSYLYNLGAGGMVVKGTQDEINQKEFDYLIRCYTMSRQFDYPFWEANSMQALSEHLQVKKYRNKLMEDNLPSIQFINTDYMPDSLLAGNLAQRSLDIFKKYGDVYQIAGAYRTLAQCYWQINDYHSAIICLQAALTENKAIDKAPDLIASIREQLSVVYSAIDDKQNSDKNRNIYLDLQEMTRQDRYLESRADQLNRSSEQLNAMIFAVLALIILLIILLIGLSYLRKRNKKNNTIDELLLPLEEWKRRNEEETEANNEKYESILENYGIIQLNIAKNKKTNIEQRAKTSLVNSITPFIDRMINEIKRLSENEEAKDVRKERYEYIAELTDSINDYNEMLTQWIEMRQGELSLHIESFMLQPLFDIVEKGRMGFKLKGVNLIVEPTAESVKADKTLTLFMINTIADNARKFTPSGGSVNISATSTEKYVEISIKDTGEGISEEKLNNIFNHKIYDGHGFGLMNCKGIIEKYKKISQIFNVCDISATSEQGKGSCFSFRLPKGIVKALALILMFAGSTNAMAIDKKSSLLDKADAFADSAYFCNIKGKYERTLVFADSCRHYLNLYYKTIRPEGKLLMKRNGDISGTSSEIRWLHENLPMNYQIILDIRNESAVAALALHEWELYRYNNKVYTLLFKELSADETLGEYCRVMQKSESNKTVAVTILVILFMLIFPAYYFIYYRHLLFYRFCVEKVNLVNDILLSNKSDNKKLEHINGIESEKFPAPLLKIVDDIKAALSKSIDANKAAMTNIEFAEDECKRAEFENGKLHISNSVLDNCLSTLKHETMYYPSRIRHLIEGKDSNLYSIGELAGYYKELFSILSMQAMRQVEAVKFDLKTINIAELISKQNESGITYPDVIGDKDALKYMFDIIIKQNGGNDLSINVYEHVNKYVVLEIEMKSLNMTEEQCHDIFTPKVENIPYLICRQIVRDNGESTNRRGCGITAFINEENNTTIKITLAKA